MLDANGQLIAAYEYDAFGNSLNGVNPSSAAGGEFGFHGAWRDSETGLYHMRARSYDAVTGRFTTPDSATPNPQAPETYEPYSFANNNPHLYSDPTGLFTLTEINVSINIQNNLQRLKTVVIQQARRKAIEDIKEFAVRSFVDQLEELLPIYGPADPSSLIRSIGAGDVGTLFQNTVLGTLKSVLPTDSLWIEPTIDVDGVVLRSHLLDVSPDAIQAVATSTKPKAVPDFLINTENPRTDRSSTTWLVGDVTLTANRLYKKYVDPARQKNQWNAITNHAEHYGLRISLFLTFYPGGPHVSPALQAKVGKEALEDGTFVFILSLKD